MRLSPFLGASPERAGPIALSPQSHAALIAPHIAIKGQEAAIRPARGAHRVKNKADFEVKYGYALAAPTTWKQYQEVSEFFTKDGMFGTDVKGAVETEWMAHVLQAGSPMVLDANNNVIIDNAAHKEALDFYVSLVNSAPTGAAQVDWAAAQNLFNQGKTAMTRFWAHAYRQIPQDSPVFARRRDRYRGFGLCP